MHPAIRVDNLSKLYQVGARQQGYKTLRESIADACVAPLRRWRFRSQESAARSQDGKPTTDHRPPTDRLNGQDFWALKDVSFEVQPGEVVGIIGRNGAGKSTLLKILSRITEPTSGKVELRGRVGSLLEVGTGFHPELTGRENVYLNGSILGMSRCEIARKFDEIVAFAEIEDFLDTPVKRYSSGMYVRLAFAVAAHLEPEILIVDEVLAVGDTGFQEKCMGKMGDVARGGRTVLFVTHNMAAVSTLCQDCLLISHGQLVEAGDARSVVQRYLTSAVSDAAGQRCLVNAHRTAGDQRIRFRQIVIANDRRALATTFQFGERVDLSLTLESDSDLMGEISFAIKSSDGYCLFTSSSFDLSGQVLIHRGVNTFSASIDPNYLKPGRYFIQLRAFSSICCDLIPEAASFEILPGHQYSQPAVQRFPGPLYFPLLWHSHNRQSS